ncbi:patatin-like phospholipase family protein [bacterium]|nr:patatin-like phospholipase family protein [bacterium]
MGKTALVLSGGGLKGAYEAGVLRTLAEAGIVPDVIVGISAGALNGAYVANMVAEGAFTPQRLDEFLVQLWATRATLEDFFYTAEGQFAPGSLGEASVQRIFHRIGIDPFKKLSWIKVGLDSLLALRELAFGRFTSICSHGFIKQMLEDYLVPPERLVHPVTFSIAVSDLLGTTHLEKDQIAARHCHYETFKLAEPLSPEATSEQYAWMRSVIMASCSVPTVFPATKMHLTGQERPGLYLDGGMVENSPITQAIELDAEVDTVFVVMAATVVGEPSREPATFVQMIGRVFSIIAGRYLIQNFHDVRRMNERILAMRQVLERNAKGEIRRSEHNERLCQAAGFNDLESFLKKRYVRLVPIGPTTPLPGGMFSALYYPELKRVYLERGVEDGRAAIAALANPLSIEAVSV